MLFVLFSKSLIIFGISQVQSTFVALFLFVSIASAIYINPFPSQVHREKNITQLKEFRKKKGSD